MLRCPDTTTKPLAFGNAAGAIARDPKELSNFPNAEYLSYSFQNPYPSAAALLSGFRWNVTLDETYAVAADRNPGEAAARLQAPRYVPPSTQPGAMRYGMQSSAAATPAGNSPNHHRAGQNVAYADGHVEWQVTPFAGPVLGSGANQWRDNIYTARTAADQRTGGQIVAPPFDRDDNILLPAVEAENTR